MSAKGSKQTKDTKTKEPKETKETKKIKQEPVVVSDMEVSGMEEQDEQSSGLMRGYLNRKPEQATGVLMFIKLAKKHILEDNDVESYNRMLDLAYGGEKPEEELNTLIKKHKKKEEKKEITFQPEGLKKPSNGKQLFDKYYAEQCRTNGTKFMVTDSPWSKLSQNEKDKYIEQAKKNKAIYDIEFARLKNEAIADGKFPEPKPKAPSNGYIQYLAEVRPSLTKKNEAANLKGIAANAKITTDAAAMWKSLSVDKQAKYNLIYKKAKVEYDQQIIEWKARAASRLKKLNASGDAEGGAGAESSTEDIDIESTGNTTKTDKKSKTSKKKVVKVDEDEDDSTDAIAEIDIEEVEEEPIVSKGKGKGKAATPAVATKKNADKISKSKLKIKVESDQEELEPVEEEPVEDDAAADADEQEVIIEKPKANKQKANKTSAKTKVKIESSSDNDE